MAEREPVVRVRDLGTRIGGRWAHRGLDLDVYRGEFLSVVGSSGSGKTLLLQQMIGLMIPQEGSVCVFGEDVHRAEPEQAYRLRTHWGVLFQKGALFSALTVYDNVAFPLRELRTMGDTVSERTIRDLVMLKLQMVGIDPQDSLKLPSELSGGMGKRVALARALALEPELLFLDEPTTGLDPDLATELDELLVNLHRELGLSALLISHDLHSLSTVSSRIAVMAEGRVLTVGTFAEVAEYDHPFVRQFFHGKRGETLLACLR